MCKSLGSFSRRLGLFLVWKPLITSGCEEKKKKRGKRILGLPEQCVPCTALEYQLAWNIHPKQGWKCFHSGSLSVKLILTFQPTPFDTSSGPHNSGYHNHGTDEEHGTSIQPAEITQGHDGSPSGELALPHSPPKHLVHIPCLYGYGHVSTCHSVISYDMSAHYVDRMYRLETGYYWQHTDQLVHCRFMLWTRLSWAFNAYQGMEPS